MPEGSGPRAAMWWNPPPPNVQLLAHEVHVWRIPLKQPESTIQCLKKVLAEDELMRAGRFFFDNDRHHFIVARGFLRILLGRYVGEEPGQVKLRSNAYGKPFLLLPAGKMSLHFNLSHSQDIALIACTSVGQVGIDVEYMRSDIDYEQLAQHFFSPAEHAILQALPHSAKRQAFYTCWTRKEAYIKARGIGLSLPLNLFDVSVDPAEPAALLESREDPEETARWALHTLDPHPGYAATLAIEGKGWDLRCWKWSGEQKNLDPGCD
jgi:4'-phosphopantetheinyl transferase